MDKSKRCTQFCRLSWRSELRVVLARSGFKQFCSQRHSHSVGTLMFYVFIGYNTAFIYKYCDSEKILANETLLAPRRPLFTPLEGLCSNFKALQCSYMLRSKMLLLKSSLNIKILLNNTQGIGFHIFCSPRTLQH